MLNKESNVKSYLVTGGSGGIGRAIVKDLAENYLVYNLDQKAPDAKLKGEIFIRTDLTSSDSIQSALYSIKKEQLCGIVYSAGYGGPFVDITKVTEDLWDKVFSINIRGAFILVKEFLSYFQQNRFGRIVVIASSQSIVGAKHSVAYSSSVCCEMLKN